MSLLLYMFSGRVHTQRWARTRSVFGSATDTLFDTWIELSVARPRVCVSRARAVNINIVAEVRLDESVDSC